jgi:hypothetical protein
MPERIPDNWKKAVIQILEEGDSNCITITGRALRDFQAMFPGAFIYELYDAFIDGLSSSSIEGNRIADMRPRGATYEFLFIHRRRSLYGKVCLTPDHRLVVIFSAHRPSKGDTL